MPVAAPSLGTRNDLRRVIVALVREGYAVALPVDLTEAHDPGILAGTEHHVGCLRGKVLLEDLARALVGAVLAPHRVEDVGLYDRGVSAQELDDPPGLIQREGQPARIQRLP
jgi:hypothetical protein